MDQINIDLYVPQTLGELFHLLFSDRLIYGTSSHSWYYLCDGVLKTGNLESALESLKSNIIEEVTDHCLNVLIYLRSTNKTDTEAFKIATHHLSNINKNFALEIKALSHIF